jgi:F-type H+-transporting ATPase subunit gamma
MATLKDIQLKIVGVKKTKQITKAMNMVAASKLRSAQQKMEDFRPYAAKFAEVLGSLAERAGSGGNPLLVEREEVKTVDIILMTSDRGLCGSFNNNLITKAKKFAKEKSAEGKQVRFIAAGKKGRDFARKSGLAISSEHIGVVGGRFGFNIASTIGTAAIDDFLSEATDEVYVVSSGFLSVARQVANIKKLLPIPATESEEEEEVESPATGEYLPEHICEPSAAELMEELLPRNISIQIYSALLETSASEHASRMMAMDNATTACNDMINSLTLVYNKARQAAVTAELMDIVGGAEALKG